MTPTDSGVLTVFISYSRRDASQADALVTFLESKGFRVFIDRRDLPFGEAWKSELAYFITEADCTVWLVSTASIDSRWCTWELEQVSVNRKRIVPLRLEEVPAERLPDSIGRVHLLPATGPFDLSKHGELLARTVKSNQTWIKEHTRLSNAAASWVAADRRKDLLLRGKALSNAERWRDHQPDGDASPTVQTLDFISASRTAATRRQRYSVLGLVAGLLVAAGLSSWALVSADRERKARIEAETQRREAYLAASKALSEESERLFQQGERRRALDLAIQAMPDADHPDRPYLARAEKALYQAFASPPKPVFFDAPAGAEVTKIHVIETANTVLLGDDTQYFRPFDIDTGRVRYPYPSRLDALHSQPYSVGGDRIAYTDEIDEGVVLLYELSSNTASRYKPDAEYPTVKRFALSRDGRFLAISWVDGASVDTRPPVLLTVIDVEEKSTLYQAALPFRQDQRPYDDIELRFAKPEGILVASMGDILRTQRIVGLDWKNNSVEFDVPLSLKHSFAKTYVSPGLTYAVIHDDDITRIIDLRTGATRDDIAGPGTPFDSVITPDEQFVFQNHARKDGEQILASPDYDRIDLATGALITIDCDCTIIANWPHGSALLVQALDGTFRIIDYDGVTRMRIGTGSPASATDTGARTAAVLERPDAFVVGGALPRLIRLGGTETVSAARDCVGSQDVVWGYTNGTDVIGMFTQRLDAANRCVVKKDGEAWDTLVHESYDRNAAFVGAVPQIPARSDLGDGRAPELQESSVFLGEGSWQYFHGSRFSDPNESMHFSVPFVIDSVPLLFGYEEGSDELFAVRRHGGADGVTPGSLGGAHWYSVSASGRELLVCRDDGLFTREIVDGEPAHEARPLAAAIDHCATWAAGALDDRHLFLIALDPVVSVVDRSNGEVVKTLDPFRKHAGDTDTNFDKPVGFALSKGGDRLLVNDGNREAAVYSTDTWELLGFHHLSLDVRSAHPDVWFSSDFRFAVVDGFADKIKLSDVLAGKPTPAFEIDIYSETWRTYPAGFSLHPTEPRLAVVGPSGSDVLIYDLVSREIVGRADFAKRVVAVDYFDDGTQLAVIAQNGSIDFLPAFASYAQLLQAVNDGRPVTR